MPAFSPEQRLVIAIGVPTIAFLLFLWLRRRQNLENINEDDDDDESQETEVATVFETTLEVKIPQAVVGAVIGRGGATIKQIQKDSGAYVNFKDEEEPKDVIFGESKAPLGRTVVIKGERSKARKAEFLIKKIVSDQPKLLTEDYFVPQKACGRIIGRGGLTIRHLCKVSGARIVIDRSEIRPHIPRKCTITGTADQIVNAKGLLDEKIAEHDEGMAKKPIPVTEPRVTRVAAPVEQNVMQGVCSGAQSSLPPSVQYPDTSDYVEVFVSAVDNPGHFWVQLVKTPDAKELDKLVTILTEEAKTGGLENILDTVKVGDLCYAPFRHDESWYRAQVTNVNSDGTVGLFYVDYGDSGNVPKFRLRKLRNEYLQLPFQAIECYLANTKPSEGWSQAASEFFKKLTHYPYWVGIMTKVVKYCGEIPCVDVYDTTTDKDVFVNEEMVEEGFAVKDTTYPPPPQTNQYTDRLAEEENKSALAQTGIDKSSAVTSSKNVSREISATPEQTSKSKEHSTGSKTSAEEEACADLKSANAEGDIKKEQVPDNGSKDITDSGTGKGAMKSAPKEKAQLADQSTFSLSGPVSSENYSPVKAALVKHVSKEYMNVNTDSSQGKGKSSTNEIEEEEGQSKASFDHIEPQVVEKLQMEVQSVSEIDAEFESGIIAHDLPRGEDSRVPHLEEQQPQIPQPEVLKSVQAEVKATKVKKEPNQVLKPEVEEMIKLEVSRAFESEVEPVQEELEAVVAGKHSEVFHGVRNDGVQDHGPEKDSPVDGSQVRVQKPGINENCEGLANQPHIETTTLNLAVNAAVAPDGDNDEDDDNLETFTTNYQNQVMAKKSFVSSVTLATSQSRETSDTLTPNSDNPNSVTKTVSNVSRKGTQKSYAQVVRTSKTFGGNERLQLKSPGQHAIIQSQVGTSAGDIGNHMSNVSTFEISSGPEAKALLQRSGYVVDVVSQRAKNIECGATPNSSMYSIKGDTTTESGTIENGMYKMPTTRIATVKVSTTQGVITRDKEQGNGLTPKELGSLIQLGVQDDNESDEYDNQEVDEEDSDAESFTSALDEPVSDSDTTSYDTALGQISGSTTSLDYATAEGDTDTETIGSPTCKGDGGTPVNSDSEEEEVGEKTPRKVSFQDSDTEIELTPEGVGSIAMAAKYTSEQELGYRGDSEEVPTSNEDLHL